MMANRGNPAPTHMQQIKQKTQASLCCHHAMHVAFSILSILAAESVSGGVSRMPGPADVTAIASRSELPLRPPAVRKVSYLSSGVSFDFADAV